MSAPAAPDRSTPGFDSLCAPVLLARKHVRLSLIIIMTLLLALGCYVVARYGFDAVAKQTILENEFFFGRPSEPPSKTK
jgi:hypothetical protein